MPNGNQTTTHSIALENARTDRLIVATGQDTLGPDKDGFVWFKFENLNHQRKEGDGHISACIVPIVCMVMNAQIYH